MVEDPELDVVYEFVDEDTVSTVDWDVVPDATVDELGSTPAYQALPAADTAPTDGSVIVAAFVMTINPPYRYEPEFILVTAIKILV